MNIVKAQDRKYTMLGICDEGEIVMTTNPADVFLDKVVHTFALVKRLYGEPRGRGMCGLKYYNTSCVDYDFGHITQFDTWKAIVDNGLADCIKDREDNALRFALMSIYPIEKEVFDLLYEAYPNTRLDDILWKCRRLEAAKWALEHGANKDYEGLTIPMKAAVCSHRSESPDGDAIFKFAYECDPDEYWVKYLESTGSPWATSKQAVG